VTARYKIDDRILIDQKGTWVLILAVGGAMGGRERLSVSGMHGLSGGAMAGARWSKGKRGAGGPLSMWFSKK
jgi:hypothetical protein